MLGGQRLEQSGCFFTLPLQGRSFGRGCVPVTGALARLGGRVLLLPLLVLKGSNVLIPRPCPHFCKVKLLVAQLCLTLREPVDCSPPAPLFMEFSRQEYCSALSFSSPGYLPDPGVQTFKCSLRSTEITVICKLDFFCSEFCIYLISAPIQSESNYYACTLAGTGPGV